MRPVRLFAAALVVLLHLNGFAAAAQKKQPDAGDPRSVIADVQALGPGAIDRLDTVQLGGIPQWISVRGTNPDNPILLFIHGGPGSPMMPEAWTFQRPWEDFFTVVQWDQRGAGKTFAEAKGKPDPSMTPEKLQSDAEQLIQLLMQNYGKQKIFLVGHSWGSILGLRIAEAHPDWLYAYIGIGQVVDTRRNEEVGYRETLAVAKEASNAVAIKALEALAPYPEPQGATPFTKLVGERKWDVALGGMRFGRADDDSELRYALSPLYTAKDRSLIQAGEASSLGVLVPQLTDIDLSRMTDFQCPIFFFAGAQDRTTPRSLVEDYFARIKAPQKKLFVIQRAAHYVINEAPGEVLVDLVRDVLPVAIR